MSRTLFRSLLITMVLATAIASASSVVVTSVDGLDYR
jgi:hypothetical protein